MAYTVTPYDVDGDGLRNVGLLVRIYAADRVSLYLVTIKKTFSAQLIKVIK